MKLGESLPTIKNLLEAGDDMRDRLWQRLQAKLQSGDVQDLSDALGHDPDDEEGDCLDPEELLHDRGWAWDVVRDYFREGAVDDVQATLGVAKALGIDVSGLDHHTDWSEMMNELQSRI